MVNWFPFFVVWFKTKPSNALRYLYCFISCICIITLSFIDDPNDDLFLWFPPSFWCDVRFILIILLFNGTKKSGWSNFESVTLCSSTTLYGGFLNLRINRLISCRVTIPFFLLILWADFSGNLCNPASSEAGDFVSINRCCGIVCSVLSTFSTSSGLGDNYTRSWEILLCFRSGSSIRTVRCWISLTFSVPIVFGANLSSPSLYIFWSSRINS